MSTRAQRAAKTKLEQQLIELVKLKPVIYCTAHPDHKNSVVVENAWTFIFESMGGPDIISDEQACCELWKSLWSQYLAHKRKLVNKSGQKRKQRAFFRHEESMSFFDDKDNKNDTTMSNVESETIVDDEDDVNQLLTPDSQVDLSPNGTCTVSIPSSSRHQPSTPIATITNPSPLLKSRIHQAGHNSKAHKRTFDDQLIDCLKAEPLNEFQHFCSGIAIKLHKINEKDKKIALRAQRNMQDAIMDAELELLDKEFLGNKEPILD